MGERITERATCTVSHPPALVSWLDRMKIAMGTLHLRAVRKGFHTRLRSAKLSALSMCMQLAAVDLDSDMCRSLGDLASTLPRYRLGP